MHSDTDDGQNHSLHGDVAVYGICWVRTIHSSEILVAFILALQNSRFFKNRLCCTDSLLNRLSVQHSLFLQSTGVGTFPM